MKARPILSYLTMHFPHEGSLDQLYLEIKGEIVATVTCKTRKQTVEFTRLFVKAESSPRWI